jgi:hypothetical protein
MTMSPEQMRKNSLAQAESLKHQRYAQADGSMKQMNTEPLNSTAIHAEVARVNAATNKETASIDAPTDDSYNSGRI